MNFAMQTQVDPALARRFDQLQNYSRRLARAEALVYRNVEPKRVRTSGRVDRRIARAS